MIGFDWTQDDQAPSGSFRHYSPPVRKAGAVASPPAVFQDASVRRLTPVECERLQALPDGWTQLGNTPDSKRYAALGDAVTATVAEWIGHQLLQHLRVAA